MTFQFLCSQAPAAPAPRTQLQGATIHFTSVVYLMEIYATCKVYNNATSIARNPVYFEWEGNVAATIDPLHHALLNNSIINPLPVTISIDLPRSVLAGAGQTQTLQRFFRPGEVTMQPGEFRNNFFVWEPTVIGEIVEIYYSLVFTDNANDRVVYVGGPFS